MSELTSQQEKVLKYISERIRDHELPPTNQEIVDHFGWASPNAATCHLAALELKGAIKRIKGKARGIEVLDRYYF